MSNAKKTKKSPLARIRAGSVIATIWPRDTKWGTFYDVTIQRSNTHLKSNNATTFDAGGQLALEYAMGLAHEKIRKLQAIDRANDIMSR
jgi:hypothetical protein